MTVGVIAYQGAYARHIATLRTLGVTAREVREPHHLSEIDGVIIPGGESTTIGMLMERFAMTSPLRRAIQDGLPTMGTCAGAILLSRTIQDSDQTRLGILDATIARNAYGRQIDSFETTLSIPTVGIEKLPGVFIRAPRFVEVGPTVEILSRFESHPVIVRQGSILALTFHPRAHQRYPPTPVLRRTDYRIAVNPSSSHHCAKRSLG